MMWNTFSQLALVYTFPSGGLSWAMSFSSKFIAKNALLVRPFFAINPSLEKKFLYKYTQELPSRKYKIFN